MSRGQGSTEYVVVLAVVLGIVMVTFSILGFFSGFSEDARADDSQTYWANAASPFAIIDYKFQSSDSRLYMKIQNKAGVPLNLTSINFTSNDMALTYYSGIPVQVLPGGAVTVVYSSSKACQPSKAYEFGIQLGYRTPSIANLTEGGVKPFIVRCTQ